MYRQLLSGACALVRLCTLVFFYLLMRCASGWYFKNSEITRFNLAASHAAMRFSLLCAATESQSALGFARIRGKRPFATSDLGPQRLCAGAAGVCAAVSYIIL